MSTTVGFQWGKITPKINEKSNRNNDSAKFKFNSKKRKFHEDKTDKIEKIESDINKRAKIPIIKGEKLPVTRMIESLNHENVVNLLTELVKVHPEITKTINDIQPKISIEESIKLISNKFQMIKNNLPYKEELNDYSYLRIKPYLNEFLNCLSDFILNYLPPIENNFINSLTFIDFSTNLIIELPDFKNKEFEYIKSKCFEQISNTWLIILNEMLNENNENDENLYNFIKIVNDLDLKNKIMSYNESCDNKFENILEFINSKVKVNAINEFITIDYSNYLTANSST